MEQAKSLGLAKSIGISNFNTSQIDRLLANTEVKPTVLQVEVRRLLSGQVDGLLVLFLRYKNEGLF